VCIFLVIAIDRSPDDCDPILAILLWVLCYLNLTTLADKRTYYFCPKLFDGRWSNRHSPLLLNNLNFRIPVSNSHSVSSAFISFFVLRILFAKQPYFTNDVNSDRSFVVFLNQSPVCTKWTSLHWCNDVFIIYTVMYFSFKINIYICIGPIRLSRYIIINR